MWLSIRLTLVLSSISLSCLLTSCNRKTERSGVVVDRDTNEPLSEVSIDIYLKYQTGDSLEADVVTDLEGKFHIKEKRRQNQLFELNRDGYITFVTSLPPEMDTVQLEKQPAESIN